MLICQSKYMSECRDYKFNWINVFIPTMTEMRRVCYSFNKTFMVIAVTLRVIVYSLFFKYIYDRKIIGLGSSKFRSFGFVTLAIILGFCYLSLLAALLKKQEFAKPMPEVEPEPEDIALTHIAVKTPKPTEDELARIAQSDRKANIDLYKYDEINNDRSKYTGIVYSTAGGFLNSETGQYVDYDTGGAGSDFVIVLNESQQEDPTRGSFAN